LLSPSFLSLSAPITPISLSPNPFPPSSSCRLFLLLLLCSFSFSALPLPSLGLWSVGQSKPRRLPGVWWFLGGRGRREGLPKAGAESYLEGEAELGERAGATGPSDGGKRLGVGSLSALERTRLKAGGGRDSSPTLRASLDLRCVLPAWMRCGEGTWRRRASLCVGAGDVVAE
jgi:hypothetical protein